MLLCSWLYHSTLPPEKQNKNIFNLMHAWAAAPAAGYMCAIFVSVVLVVPQPIGVHVLNQLTNRSVLFSSHSVASLPGETTSIFNRFKSPCSQVINLVKKLHTKLSGKNISTEKFLCIVWSTQNAQHVKCSACFLGQFGHPGQNVRHRAPRQLEASHQQRKSSRKYTEDFPFYGL